MMGNDDDDDDLDDQKPKCIFTYVYNNLKQFIDSIHMILIY
jgi:hypothetical protein